MYRKFLFDDGTFKFLFFLFLVSIYEINVIKTREIVEIWLRIRNRKCSSILSSAAKSFNIYALSKWNNLPFLLLESSSQKSDTFLSSIIIRIMNLQFAVHKYFFPLSSEFAVLHSLDSRNHDLILV